MGKVTTWSEFLRARVRKMRGRERRADTPAPCSHPEEFIKDTTAMAGDCGYRKCRRCNTVLDPAYR